MIAPSMKRLFAYIGYAGIGFLVADTYLSTKFGWTMAPEMALVYGLISLGSGLLLSAAVYFLLTDYKRFGGVLVAAWVPLFGMNVWSNMGVSTANRMADVQRASVQQAKYDGAQDAAKEAATNLSLWQSQLAKLKADHAWVATVTADALRGQLAELQAASDREAKRGGCGPKCEALKTQVRDVQGKIGAAEQRDDLTKRIEATQRLVDGYRTKADKTDAGISYAANTSTLYAKLINWNWRGEVSDMDIAVANEGTGATTAIVLAIGSVALMLIALWPNLMEAIAFHRNGGGITMADLAPRRTEDDKARLDVPAMGQPIGLVPPKETHSRETILQPFVVDNEAFQRMRKSVAAIA